MARKRGKGRKYRRYMKGQISHSMAVGALATQDVKTSSNSEVLTESAWLSSVKAIWAMQGGAFGADEGPVLVGISHSDYTAAEIEEWIENAASWDQNDEVGKEVARRKIRRVGIFHGLGVTTEAEVMNDSKPIHTKCGWLMGTGQTVTMWAYNTGTETLQSGYDVKIEGHANLWPTN